MMQGHHKYDIMTLCDAHRHVIVQNKLQIVNHKKNILLS